MRSLPSSSIGDDHLASSSSCISSPSSPSSSLAIRFAMLVFLCSTFSPTSSSLYSSAEGDAGKGVGGVVGGVVVGEKAPSCAESFSLCKANDRKILHLEQKCRNMENRVRDIAISCDAATAATTATA